METKFPKRVVKMANYNIDVIYSAEYDVTFIIETSYEDGEKQSTEVVGIYPGQPSEEKTRQNYNNFKINLKYENKKTSKVG